MEKEFQHKPSDNDPQTADPEQSAGMKSMEADQDPAQSLEDARNAAAGEGPNASGSNAPSSAEEHVPGTSDPEATDLPTANSPHT